MAEAINFTFRQGDTVRIRTEVTAYDSDTGTYLPVDMTGKSLKFALIDPDDDSIALSKLAVDAEVDVDHPQLVTLTITSAETAALAEGVFDVEFNAEVDTDEVYHLNYGRAECVATVLKNVVA